MIETPTPVVDAQKALEIVSRMTGKDGILEVVKSASKSIEDLKSQRSKIDSQISSYVLLIQTLRRLAIAWGLEEVPEVKPQAQPAQESSVDPVVAERVAKGLCLYKDQQTKKWCQRTLSTDEKEVGYCKACQVRLGLIKEQETVEQERVPQTDIPSLKRRGKNNA